MSIVNSVLGPVDVGDLGFTLMHEHLLVAGGGIPPSYSGLLGARFMDRIVHGLTEAKEAGVNTIVDASTVDLGRDVTVMAEASRLSGVNIIACTGLYVGGPAPPAYRSIR